MKIFTVLFLHLIFIGLFKGYHSSDPDSVLVQSPEMNIRKSGRIQMEDNQEKAFISVQGPRFLIVRYMQPVVYGSRKVWREVRRETIDRTQHLSPYQNAWVNYLINQPGINQGTEKRIIDNNSETVLGDNIPVVAPNIVKGNTNNNDNPITINPLPVTPESKQPFVRNEKIENVETKPPRRISADSNFFAGIVNNFAFKLVETLNLESNFVISPLSIFVALSMCYLGADGRTKAQLEKAMGMDDNAVHGEHLHKGISDLLSVVMDDTEGYKVFVANGMFLGKNFTVDAQFDEEIRKYYDAEIKNLDFGNRQLSHETINAWVTNKTKNMITSINNSPPPALTRLILLNAIYFEGKWKMQFPVNLTSSGKFHSLNGNEKEVQFMNMRRETFPVFQSDDHKHSFIKLPYEGDQLSMIIALPYTKSDKPMPSVTDEILCHVQDAMLDTRLQFVAIPKFHLEYKKSLIKPLQGLGMTDMFDWEQVNFSKLRKENDIYVSDVIHKAVVKVNEEGTMASAITSVRFFPTSAGFSFIADHPFAFYIVHEPTGLVLFYGKVIDF